MSTTLTKITKTINNLDEKAYELSDILEEIKEDPKKRHKFKSSLKNSYFADNLENFLQRQGV